MRPGHVVTVFIFMLHTRSLRARNAEYSSASAWRRPGLIAVCQGKRFGADVAGFYIRSRQRFVRFSLRLAGKGQDGFYVTTDVMHFVQMHTGIFV